MDPMTSPQAQEPAASTTPVTVPQPAGLMDQLQATLAPPEVGPPAQPFDINSAWDTAISRMRDQTPEALAAKRSTETTGTASRILQASGAGILQAGFEAKDFLLGAPPEADKWPFRRYVEAKGRSLAEQSVGYGLVTGVSQFAAGMVGAGATLKAASLVPKVGAAVEAIAGSSKGAAALETAKAATVGAVAFDPHQERLGNLIEQVPELQGSILTFTASKPDDTAAEGRMKSAIESIGLDAAVAGTLWLGLKAYRAMAHGDVKVAQEAVAEIKAAEAQAPASSPAPIAGGVNDNLPLVTSSNDNFKAGVPLNPDAPNPLGSSERSPAASGNPATSPGGSAPEAANANFKPDPNAIQDNGSAGPVSANPQSSPAQATQAPTPKTVGEFFDAGLKPKTMAEDVGVTKPDSVSGDVPGGPTITAHDTVTSAKKASGPKVPTPLEATPEEAAAIIDNMTSDAEALKHFGSRQAALEGGYQFSGISVPWQKLTGPEDLQMFLDNMAGAMKPAIDGAKGGEVMSDPLVEARVRQLANAYGQKPDVVIGNLQMAGDAAATMAAKMEAADAIATKMADEAFQVAQKIQVGNLSEWGGDSIAAMGEFTKRVGLAMTTFGAARSMLSNSARTLRRARGDLGRLSFEEISKISSMDPEALLKIFQGSGGDTEALREALSRPGLLKRVIDGASYLQVNNILWGWTTHAVNLAGNAFMLFSRPVEKIIGGTVLKGADFLGASIPGASEVVKKANYELRSTDVFAKDAWLNAAKAFTDYESIMDPHMVEASRIGSGSIPQFRPINGIEDLAWNALAGAYNAIGFPTRAMGAVDELVKQIRYRSYVSAEARAQAESLGLSGQAALDHVSSSLSAAFDANGVAIDTKALNEARVSTFQQSLLRKGSEDTWGGVSSLGAVAQDSTSNAPYLRFILPFVKTPANVLRMGIKYTPGLNMLQKEYANAMIGAKGVEAQAQAIGQMALGSLAWTSFIGLALDGRVTGGGPSNPKLKAELLATGWKPYSVVHRNEDGSFTYVSFNKFDPIAIPLGIAADLVDIWQHPDRLEASHEMLPMAMALALAKNVEDKSYLRSLSMVVQALGDPEKNGAKWVGGLAGNLVPFSSATKNYGGDPYMHDVRGVLDGIMASTPGLSESLPPRRDAFGDPITVSRGFWSSSQDNLVDNEIIRLGIESNTGLSAPSPKIKGVDLRDLTLEDGTNAYEKYQELRGHPPSGPSLKDQVAKLIASPAYQRMADGDGYTRGTKSAALRDITGKYQDAAIKRLMVSSPIVRDALTAAQKQAAAAFVSGQKPPSAAGGGAYLQGLLGAFGLGGSAPQ